MSLSALCKLFGYTRQGHWRHVKEHYRDEIDATALLGEVREIRKEMPRCGTRKIQVLLEDRGHRIGRDRLFSLLRSSGLLVHRKHYRVVTTCSKHWMRKYANLVKGIVPDRPNQIWVSDITYVEVTESGKRMFLYLSLVTDAYTHEIVGYALHDTLDTDGPLKALHMALAEYGSDGLAGLIHHSDRGCQYCSQDYVNELKAYGIRISMTDNGDPYENAVAERVNGILKTEWLYHTRLTSRRMAYETVQHIVHLYNNERPHLSIDMRTPSQARAEAGPLNRRWKNYWALKHATRQQPTGGEVCPGSPAAGRVVSAALPSSLAAVPVS